MPSHSKSNTPLHGILAFSGHLEVEGEKICGCALTVDRAVLTSAESVPLYRPCAIVPVDEEGIDNLIAACVPGGDICDPQAVADAIRNYLSPQKSVSASSKLRPGFPPVSLPLKLHLRGSDAWVEDADGREAVSRTRGFEKGIDHENWLRWIVQTANRQGDSNAKG